MNVLFIVAGLMAIAGVLGVIFAKQPVHQVLSTVFSFIGLAALYLSLTGEFMAVIQLIVYGGAVMILFLFVISLLSARKDMKEREDEKGSLHRVLGFSFGGAVLLLLAVVGLAGQEGGKSWAQVSADFGQVQPFGYELLTSHVFAFEVLAFILMVAVIGVVVLVGRQKA